MPRESYDQGKLLAALNARPQCYAVKYHASAYTGSGVPDILCCYRGLFVAFELKNRRIKNAYKGLSPDQVAHLQRINQADGLAFAIHTVGEAMKVLDEIDAKMEACK